LNVRPRRRPQLWLRGCALSALLGSWLAVAAAAESGGGIVVLAGATSRAEGGRAREAVLVDALRIYTRDLGRTVRLGGRAPAALTAEALDRVAGDARLSGADVVVWFGERAGVPLLYALKAASLELRETAVAAGDTLGSARAAALKVRALLAPVADDTQWAVPPEAPTPRPNPPAVTPPPTMTKPPPATTPIATVPPTTTPTATAPTATAPPTTAPTATAPAPSPVATSPAVATAPAPNVPPAATSVQRRPAPTSRRHPWLEATVAYELIVPTRPDWLRQGLVVRLTVPFGRVPLAAFVDGAFTNAPSVTVDGATIGARIWPVGAGIVARLLRPRWQLAVGPRASLQIVEADAAGAGRATHAQRLSAGVGLHAEGAWLFSRYVGAVVALGGEALVPRQQLAAGGPHATDLGWAQFMLSAGLLLRIP
jgi:hypothetical protein